MSLFLLPFSNTAHLNKSCEIFAINVMWFAFAQYTWVMWAVCINTSCFWALMCQLESLIHVFSLSFSFSQDFDGLLANFIHMLVPLNWKGGHSFLFANCDFLKSTVGSGKQEPYLVSLLLSYVSVLVQLIYWLKMYQN